MPIIRKAGRTQPSIGSMREKVVVCTWTETPDDDVSVIVKRPGVFSTNARVLPITGAKLLDYQVKYGNLAPDTEVTLRVPPDVYIALNHWIFWPSRFRETWLRVRTVEDLGNVGRFLVLLCSTVDLRDGRCDPATQYASPNFILPDDRV